MWCEDSFRLISFFDVILSTKKDQINPPGHKVSVGLAGVVGPRHDGKQAGLFVVVHVVGEEDALMGPVEEDLEG